MLAACLAAKADDIRGHIVDAGSNDAVAYATVTITDSHNRKLTTVSDISGYFMFQDLSSDRYTITVSYLGYHTLTQTYTSRNGETVTLTLKLKQDNRVLNEVVVTAHESQGITTSSVIDRKAIEHLQPSSFTDLVSLLPGGTTQLPDLTNANKGREQLRYQCEGNTVCSRWHPDEYQCQHADREAGFKRHRR